MGKGDNTPRRWANQLKLHSVNVLSSFVLNISFHYAYKQYNVRKGAVSHVIVVVLY